MSHNSALTLLIFSKGINDYVITSLKVCPDIFSYTYKALMESMDSFDITDESHSIVIFS